MKRACFAFAMGICSAAFSSGCDDTGGSAQDALSSSEAGSLDASLAADARAFDRDAGGTDAPAGNSAFETMARTIERDYLSWGRVDDELRWAPFLCRIPNPGVARLSQSDDPDTHGRKLYSVFAKNHSAYPEGPHDGQVVVKESWFAERVEQADASFQPGTSQPRFDGGDHFYPYAKNDGGIFRASRFAGLYIMFKLDVATPETDNGWVYATITADGRLTAVGRVTSCMHCHEDAAHDRLFGVPKAPVPF